MAEPAHLTYARDVAEGRITAGRLMVRAAERCLRDHESPPGPWRWYPQPVEARLRFAAEMPLVQGVRAGSKLRLLPWQAWNLAEIWGWRHEDDPHRMRYRQSLLEVAKGAGKTPICAVEMLYCVLHGVPGTEVMSFATRQDQARLVFDAAARMIGSPAAPPTFAQHFRVTSTVIEGVRSGVRARALPSTSRNLDGYNISYLVFDEAASLTNRERTMDILSAARKQPSAHTRWITTAQAAARDRLYYERRMHCIDVLEGRTQDERIHAAIYAVDPEDERGDNWLDPSCWPKANPSLGVTQDHDMIEDALREAKHSPSTRADNLAKHLNIYSGSAVQWVDVEEWRACRQDDGPAATDPVEWLDALGRAGIEGTLTVGVDLAENRDLTAVTCALAETGAAGRVFTHYACFAPMEAVARLPVDVQELWQDAISRGVLRVHSGPVTDYRHIEDYVRALDKAAGRSLLAVAADRYNASELLTRLEEDRIQVMAIPQTVTHLNGPTKQLERWIANRRLRHDGDPFIEWQLRNAQLYQAPNNNVRLSKPTTLSVYKIDSIAALVNAVAALCEAEPEQEYVFLAVHF